MSLTKGTEAERVAKVRGDSTGDSIQIDLLPETERGKDLLAASQLVSKLGGEVLGIGIYEDPPGGEPVFYLHLRHTNPEAAVAVLQSKGYTVLGMHP